MSFMLLYPRSQTHPKAASLPVEERPFPLVKRNAFRPPDEVVSLDRSLLVVWPPELDNGRPGPRQHRATLSKVWTASTRLGRADRCPE